MPNQGIFRAADIHRDWKRAISTASLSVRVFTPYFDRLLPALLRGAKDRGLTVEVITDLSPTGGQDYPAQLRAAKRLLEIGVSLRSLSRLHAKVLQIDRNIVGVGSQNFTTFARSSREASVIPQAIPQEGKFLLQLDQWATAAELVDLKMLDALTAQLSKQFKAFANQEKALRAEYDGLLEDERRRRYMLSIQERLRKAAAASTVRLADGPAIGMVKLVNDFETFAVENGSDLTRWREHGETTVLPRLKQFPIIREDTGQIAFCRLGKTRISYIHWGVTRNTVRVKIGADNYEVSIILPKKDCSSVNVVVNLKLYGSNFIKAMFRFDGVDFTFVDAVRAEGRSASEADATRVAAVSAYFNVPKNRADFFSAVFGNFVFKTLGRDSPNAPKYFGGSRYKISILRFNGTPVLLASPC